MQRVTTPGGRRPAYGNRLLDSLSADERTRLAPFLEEIELPVRTTLCESGEPIAYAVFPVDAITSTLVDMPEGGSIEVGLMGAEGMVGLDLLYRVRESPSTVIVQLAGRGVRMRADDLDREVVVPNSTFYMILLRYSRAFFAMVGQSGACNATHSVEQRLARWLLMVHDRVQRDRFALTHEFISLMLGVRRATVSEAAHMLRSAGAIDYDRGEIRVLQREALERHSCGCYEVIRKLSASPFAA
jgi:CRP-like cAMP-binding protein